MRIMRDVYASDRYFTFPRFHATAEYLKSRMQQAGLTSVELVETPADGVTQVGYLDDAAGLGRQERAPRDPGRSVPAAVESPRRLPKDSELAGDVERTDSARGRHRRGRGGQEERRSQASTR